MTKAEIEIEIRRLKNQLSVVKNMERRADARKSIERQLKKMSLTELRQMSQFLTQIGRPV